MRADAPTGLIGARNGIVQIRVGAVGARARVRRALDVTRVLGYYGGIWVLVRRTGDNAMPFQSVPNTAEVVIEGELDGEQAVNTHYAKFASAYTQDDLNALASAVDDWVGAVWLPLMPTNYHYTRTVARGLTSEIDMEAEDNTFSGSGTGGVNSGANNQTLSVKRRSAFTGRGARGRIFVPGIYDGAKADDNHVAAGFVTAIETALNGLTDVMGDVDWLAVIVHRVAGGVPLATAVTFTLVEWVVVNTVIDSMRRRLPGRGS